MGGARRQPDRFRYRGGAHADSDGELLHASRGPVRHGLVHRRLVYTRNGALNQTALQDKLAALEGGEAAAVFATGVAALRR